MIAPRKCQNVELYEIGPAKLADVLAEAAEFARGRPVVDITVDCDEDFQWSARQWSARLYLDIE